MTSKEIIEAIRKSGYDRVKIAVCDIDGILRGKIILRDKFEEIADDSFGFCDVIFGWDASDVCYTNNETTGWHTAYPDAKAFIDLSTYREIPWNDKQPFFLADFAGNEKFGNVVCPRSVLKTIVAQADEMGILPVFSQEFEWFNFIGDPKDIADSRYCDLQPITPGMFGYSILRASLNQDYFNDLFDLLGQFNIPLEGLHTETGPGVFEAAIRHDTILAAADKAVLFKTSVKEIAYRHGIMASFMAKWNKQYPGCSGHIHQSLWDKKRQKNLFYDPKAKEQMSKTMCQYLAGVLHCLPHLVPLYAPTINSYKRLIEGTWAPTTISWGIENRTTAVRVIQGSKKTHRLEMRIPGSDANPYLAMAASLASGLYGIKNKLELKQLPTAGNAYADASLIRTPATLHEATQRMKESPLAKELFGEGFVKHFCTTREWEWQQYCEAVTNWETSRYFEII